MHGRTELKIEECLKPSSTIQVKFNTSIPNLYIKTGADHILKCHEAGGTSRALENGIREENVT